MMGFILIALGIGLLVWTYYEYQNGESDTIYLLDWDWVWFDVNRVDHPLLFKAALIAQVIAGLGMIGAGIAEL